MGQSFDPVAATREAVADQEEIPPEVLPPLDEWIESATFQKLMTDWHEQTAPVAFTYIWYAVTVYPSGEVTVRPQSTA